jgi:hypothetical protein
VLVGLLPRFTSRLRFPQLFALTLVVFLVDLLVPDMVPFIDEVLLGLTTLLLANWKKRPEGQTARTETEASGTTGTERPIIDVEPGE